MQQKHITIITLFFILSLTGLSCKKYLDLKPDKKMTVPSSVKDLQALLDNNGIMNKKSPTYDEASADNYYIPLASYLKMSLSQRKAYIWENYDYNYSNDWSQLYDGVYYANEVMHSLGKIDRNPANENEWDNVKGSALVYRSASFLKAAWIFAKAYDEQTADQDYGIVLRLDPDFDQPVNRASVKESYMRIISDLEMAAALLPAWPVHAMRPSGQAAYGLLARTYLSMRIYDSAYKYADLCLGINSSLMDYNEIDVAAVYTFPRFNKEVIMNTQVGVMKYEVGVAVARVDSNLYKTYDEYDLRKKAFFRLRPDGYLFKGTYTGDFGNLFTGIATDEMYLTRAECYARRGDKDKALEDLNFLLSHRFTSGSFIPVGAASAEEALDIILLERRKELIFRGLRWMDIKRLNKEDANIILERVVDGQIYTLMPNENRYALPLPADIISMTGISQNPK